MIQDPSFKLRGKQLIANELSLPSRLYQFYLAVRNSKRDADSCKCRLLVVIIRKVPD